MIHRNILKVVIADDSDTLRERLVDLLSDKPAIEIVGEARDGLGAEVLIRRLKPDVVILDIRMPGESGIDVLRRIKKNGSGPIVMMFTNYPYKQYRSRCLGVGADYFFDKSTEFVKIPEVLEQLAMKLKKKESKARE
jgi:DNA-binding NarL/FixJ family response regulator